MKLCVIGDPVGHSMSPVLHRRMLALSGIEGDYQSVTVTRETLPDFMAAGRAGEWDGCNVTMPLKQEVIRYLDQLSPEAEACGAVNTVCFRNGHTVGYNTDAPGIRAGFAARGAAPTGRALVIGNGGAARAARWALADRGVITAARRGGDVTMDQLPKAARQCRVVVNATPLGMEGFPPFADLSFLGSLPAGAAVFDLIYAPRKTELYQAARARGLIAITGMELLVQQAILAFNHFTGAGLEQEATRRELLALVNET